ncbi:FAD-binding oxidoreductase [Puteibacter caeruleilacunae]|nr:FAD-binding oxidoreductase [Puteibacter caeruleilacunae]
MLNGKYKLLYEDLVAKIQASRIFHDPLSTLTQGTDASIYRLTPQLVVKADNADEVEYFLKQINLHEIPVTFRGAGTSLSGQAITDNVLLVTGQGWNACSISDNGKLIHLQPGITGAQANEHLEDFGRIIGPDPTSMNTAKIGGIAANNSSGIFGRIKHNAYHTLHSMKLIFHDGTFLDTADEESKAAFIKTHKQLLEEIKSLSRAVRANEPLTERIRQKFNLKNTVGYSINALVDFDDPFDIIQHLMIGSEGTLGFIAEITLKTIEKQQFNACALIIFDNVVTTCKAARVLQQYSAAAAELIDSNTLSAIIQHEDGLSHLENLPQNSTALIVDINSDSNIELNQRIDALTDALQQLNPLYPITFYQKPEEKASVWKIRKGLFASLGISREPGTALSVEDVVFPLNHLEEALHDLQILLNKHKYFKAGIFGHMLDGNIHIAISHDFTEQQEVRKYKLFIDELTTLVVNKYSGALRAEHGTGRTMAPFVLFEWGDEAYELMKRVKQIFDPKNLLNPGVILNDNPKVHLQNLKPFPKVNEFIDSCSECGFCESICSDEDWFLSPRQRITAYREILRLRKTGENQQRLAHLELSYQCKANKNKTSEGICSFSCPADFDKKSLQKELEIKELTFPDSNFKTWIENGTAGIAKLLRSITNILH